MEEKDKKGKTIETYIPIGFYDNWVDVGGRGREVKSRKDCDG